MDHQVTAELLGNYGEFVGAFAVVISMVYLASQLRQNTLSQNRPEQNTSYEQSGVNDTVHWNALKPSLRENFRAPENRDWWAINSKLFGDGFAREIEDIAG